MYTSNTETLAGRRGVTPRRSFRDYSATICVGELKHGMTDALFKADIKNFDSISGHARSLTELWRHNS